MSRLISRLRHRQFGVLVTTSYVDSQAYREIKEDQHPIVVIAAADIVVILRSTDMRVHLLWKTGRAWNLQARAIRLRSGGSIPASECHNALLRLGREPGVRLEIVDDDRRLDRPGYVAEMTMVGEVNDLPRGGHAGEQPEGFFGAEVVERLHDVVGEERGWGMRAGELVISRHAQCQV